MKIKVKDVARAAGVSTTAVSLVLNGKPSRLSDSTKEKIMRVAREMAFQNEFAIEPLSYQRVKTLGLVAPNIDDPVYTRLVTSIQEYGYTKGYTVFLSICQDDAERCCAAVESLAMKNVDGLLLIAPSTVEKEDRLTKMIKSLQDNGMPIVLIDRAIYSIFSDFVTSDNKYGGRMAAQCLADKGFDKIGCILGPARVYTSRKRLQGYQEGLARAKLTYNEAFVYHGEYTKASGKAGAEKLYERGCKALFVANDLMAAGALEFVREKNLRAPEDIEIVGYDVPAEAEIPGIQQNITLMAEKAVDRIVERLEKEGGDPLPPGNFYITPLLRGRGH